MRSEKAELRRRVWKALEERGLARFPRPVYGRIPNFVGAREAGSRILELDEYRSAEVVKVNPDSPQRFIRYRCLLDGKILIMPTPRLRQGFLLLDPAKIPKSLYERASTIRGAFEYGELVEPEKLPEIDLIVVGSVAVSRSDGTRIGKGGGYGELEYAILRELGKVGEETPIATNVHDIQVYDSLPRDEHDLSVDYIATPTKLIKVKARSKRPRGILWNLLNAEKLEEIPLLKKLREKGLER